jgi:serine/threonine protein kinase
MKIPETLKWKVTGKTLGQGGQGVVHEVINKEEQNGKKYALKALSKGKPLVSCQASSVG